MNKEQAIEAINKLKFAFGEGYATVEHTIGVHGEGTPMECYQVYHGSVGTGDRKETLQDAMDSLLLKNAEEINLKIKSLKLQMEELEQRRIALQRKS